MDSVFHGAINVMKYTIATGNLVDGFELYGVFDSETDAIAWADSDAHLPDSWHVVPIQPSTDQPDDDSDND